MNLLTKFALAALFLALPASAIAAAPGEEQPRWSVEVKYGLFYPDFNDWSTYYGSNHTWDVAGAIGYKVRRQVELGVEAGMMRDTGRGLAPTMNVVAGDVQYSLWPLNVYALYRAVFKEDQLIVPYAGGGWTRMFYQEKIQDQSTIKGSADGYHGRAGIQILLDNADITASNNLFKDFGIRHTYLVLEVEYSRVMTNTQATAASPSRSVNLGGTSYLGGLLFEF